MAAVASHLLLSRSGQHSKPTALKVKTSFETGKHDSGRARAIRSADWRRSATTASSSGSSRTKNRLSEEEGEQRTSSNNSSTVLIELEEEPASYRRPKSEEASWEMISSAPATSLVTHDELLDLCLVDTTNVEFKGAKPVVMNVNGEKIVLPNQFTFDITPVQLSGKSSERSARGTVGQLKRVRGPNKLRVKSSQGHNLLGEIPQDLKDFLTQGTAKQEQPRKKISEKAMLYIQEYPRHKCSKLPEADKQRFMSLVERLNNLHKKQEPPSRSGKPSMSAFDVRSSDPAILAAKVKEDTVMVRSLPNNELKTEATEHDHPPPALGLLKTEFSRDSGYGTGFNLQSADNHHASTQASTQTSRHPVAPGHKESNKKLNPAAAEFRSGSETAHTPFLVPKRLSRPPLTDALFEAPAAIPSQPVSIPLRPPPGLGPIPNGAVAPQGQVPPQAGPASHDNAQPAPGAVPGLPHPPPLGRFDPGRFDPRTSQATSLSGPLPESLPSVCPPVDPFSRTLNGNSTVSYSSMMPTVSGSTHNFGTASPNSFNSFPLLGSQMGLPNMNPFGTFPAHNITLPAVPLPPSFNQNLALPGPSGLSALPTSVVPAPAVGPDGKVIRPHFPVIHKPRDHDPVKQQLYEAYLEWRKANEPGYHIQCKMRQANRIVRQHQMKQARLNDEGATKAGHKPENPAWKSIVEKAKAVVASAAAAAAAEKRSRGESVREEFRAKIQDKAKVLESCSEPLKANQQVTAPMKAHEQVPAKQSAEPSDKEDKKEG